jgi:hypothetical protein
MSALTPAVAGPSKKAEPLFNRSSDENEEEDEDDEEEEEDDDVEDGEEEEDKEKEQDVGEADDNGNDKQRVDASPRQRRLPVATGKHHKPPCK